MTKSNSAKIASQQKPDYVVRFAKPAGTEIKHIGKYWYLYERLSRYDPEIGRSRKVSGKCLGKLTENGLVPTVRRLRSTSDMKISDTVDAGTAAFYWHRTAQMRQRLSKHFPDLWQWIYATAIIRAAQECRFQCLGVHYENSLLSYMYPDLLYSPSAVSSMLDSIGRCREQIAAYMKEDVSSSGRFVLFDGHRLVTASGTMELLEKAQDCKRRFVLENNLICVYSLSGSVGAPVYYKQFARSMPDAVAFSDILKECGLEGSDCTVIADKGFGSEVDFQLMDDFNLKLISPLERGNRFVTGKVPSSPSQYQHCYIWHGRAIFASVIEQEGDAIHLYYDTQLYADETADAVASMEKRNNTTAKKIEMEKLRRSRGETQLSDEELAKLTPRGVADIYADGSQMGTIMIRTNRMDLKSEEVYAVYKRRQAIEEYFEMYGNRMELEASFIRNQTDQEAWLFLNHLSSSIGISVIEDLGKIEEGKPVSFNDLNAALARITASKVGKEWQIAPVKQATGNILNKVGFKIEDLNIESLVKRARSARQRA